MPNICVNVLTVEGSGRDEFFEAAKGKDEDGEHMDVSFDSVLPVPPELREENWGTDRECFDGGEHANDDGNLQSIQVYFCTANTPPDKLFKTVSKDYTGTKFTLDYMETGCGLIGSVEFKNGVEIKNVTYSNKISDDEQTKAECDAFLKYKFGALYNDDLITGAHKRPERDK